MDVTIDFYEEDDEIEEESKENFISMIMDVSDIIPGEIEIEDEIKMGYLWRKHSKNVK